MEHLALMQQWLYGEKYATLTLKHEISAPAEQNPKKVRGPSFRVVQEPETAGEGGSSCLDLCFFLGEESKWEMCDQSNVNGRMMIQEDSYVKQKGST